jgi:flagellar basal-body rod protein FlgC
MGNNNLGFMPSLNIPVSGMTAQRLRLDVISQNVANAITTRTDDGGPYRRQITLFNEVRGFSNVDTTRNRRFGEIFEMTLSQRRAQRNQGVHVTAVIKDEQRPFTPVYDPTHPHADERGYYYLPNVNVAEEQLDSMAATQSYLNNLAVYDTLVSMAQRTLSMGR